MFTIGGRGLLYKPGCAVVQGITSQPKFIVRKQIKIPKQVLKCNFSPRQIVEILKKWAHPGHVTFKCHTKLKWSSYDHKPHHFISETKKIKCSDKDSPTV